MRTIIVAGLLAAAASTGAAAQDVGGSYTVTGTNPDGSTYRGTAEIKAVADACHISWRTGSIKSAGICMRANKAFAAYYHLGGDDGLVIYEITADGSMSGWWTIADKKGVGTETLTPR